MTTSGLSLSVVIGLFASLVAADADPSTNNAGSSSLPQGEGFSENVEITDHPAVISAEDFKSDDYTSHWDEARDKDKRVLSLVDPLDKRLGKPITSSPSGPRPQHRRRPHQMVRIGSDSLHSLLQEVRQGCRVHSPFRHAPC